MTTNIVTSFAHSTLGGALGLIPGGSLGLLASAYLFEPATFDTIADAYLKLGLLNAPFSAFHSDDISFIDMGALNSDAVHISITLLACSLTNEILHDTFHDTI